MLVEANTGRERKVGANAHKHSSPVAVVDVKIVLNDPALRELKVPSVLDLVADGSHDACRFSCLENGHDLLGVWLVRNTGRRSRHDGPSVPPRSGCCASPPA